jgi:hypothetical protein
MTNLPGHERYELWEDRYGTSFFVSTNQAARRLLPANSKLVWTCDAVSYVDAHRQKHRYLGREPYEPFLDPEDA